jgi:hypothetical protein
MRRTALGVVGLAVALALGFAVAGLASSGSATGALDSTSEVTSEETNESTTETTAPTKWVAALTARAEIPKPKGVKLGAAGTFSVTVKEGDSSSTASYKLTFRNLTGKAVAAHIHRGKPGKAGPVLLSLCGPCPSGKRGTASISKAVVNAVKSGAAYVNLHTAKNPGGEIRGQIKPVS